MKNLYDLIKDFNNNLDCTMDCGNCEYGIMRSYGDSFSCPLDLVEDMIFQKFTNPEGWRELHG